MADLVLTIPEPTGSTNGISIHIQRRAGEVHIAVTYERDGIVRSITFQPSALTSAQRTQLQNVANMLIDVAKAMWIARGDWPA